jgi:hypothetical protein
MIHSSYLTPGSRNPSGQRQNELRLLLETTLSSALNPELRLSVSRCKICSGALGDAAEYVDDALSRHLTDLHTLSEEPCASRAERPKSGRPKRGDESRVRTGSAR